uniref:G-protein coupled receptors family 1 profile domain-containing protein n=1 Tax=Ciona savignyi TaxID=51511 RepID=H2YBV9_CIOSA
VFYTNASLCDGIPECYDRQDECGIGCPNESHFCNFDISCHMTQISDISEEAGLLFILKREYCDGRPRSSLSTCPLGFDETNCTSRYYCHNSNKGLISIEQLFLCDGVLDCDDGSDEWESVCSRTRFYCRSKTPLSIPRERVENGARDCSDGSDECPPNSTKKSVFLSPFEMMGNTFFRVILWIMGVLSLCGNIIVFTVSVFKIRAVEMGKPLKLGFLWLLLNLSVSDGLMGIYILLLSAMGTQFSGKYCYHDAEWRSSRTCAVLGSMAVISTEVSAFTMTTMSIIRLLSVYFPLKMTSIKRAVYVVPIICSWCGGILIGTLPLADYRSGYFITSVWYPNYFNSNQDMSKADMEQLARRIIRFSNSSPTMDWFDVKSTITSVFQELQIKGEFGFFGETSVCLPRLFVKVGDTAWGYSIFIVILNFCLFTFMGIIYMKLYKKGKQRIIAGKRKSKLLIRTVSLVILPNICCWVPICTMALVSLAGVKLDNTVYVVCAGVLLPINSVLNPIIYSNIAVNFARK